MSAVKPWDSGSVCPEKDYPAFADALMQASFHFADDSGKGWGPANRLMEQAAEIAINAAWPYWAMQRMYREIRPLPSFDDFMGVYCRRLLFVRAALAKAAGLAQATGQ